MEETIESLAESLSLLAANKSASKIKALFEVTPTIDIAEALDEIEDIKTVVYLVKVSGSEIGADIFTELSIEKQQDIINAFTDRELLILLDELFADDIVDSLEEFPANLVNRVLKVAPKDLRKDINLLLNYKDNTAGSVMTTEFMVLEDDLDVKEALEQIRKEGKKAETIYTIFIRDKKRNLIGTLNLDELIFAKNNQLVAEIMNRDFVCCHANDDQEEVANDFKRYDLYAMAVLNKDDKLVGVITIDDIVDVIVEEATEDIAALNNVSSMDTPYLETPIYKILLKCVPWILILMVLQVFSTLILSSFQGAIEQVAILSVFTPLIMDAGGNSGGQTTTIIVRSIALDEFDKGDMKKVIWKEFRVALCIAGIIATFAFLWIMFEMLIGVVQFNSINTGIFEGGIEVTRPTTWGDKSIVSLLVASTLFVTILVSRMVGVLLPFFAKLIKKDPAVMCGPLTTTIVDIISLITYFVIWSFVFAPILGITM